MAFDLSNYETVSELNRWFQDNYPLGRIRVEIISDDPKEERMSVWAAIYRDQNDNHPAVENIARGRQSDYPRPMQRFYAEDLATSAIGRCITLLKGTNTATQDDMKKVPMEPNDWKEFVNTTEAPKEPEMTKLDEAADVIAKALGAKVIESAPSCEHGEMRLKEGVSSKTNKPYRGYVCTWSKALGQCEPLWYKLSPQGTWYLPPKSGGDA